MIVVGTTCAPWKCNGTGELAWLATAQEMKAEWQGQLQFFAALESDGRGAEPYMDLLGCLAALDGDFWTFSIDDGSEEIDSGNRLIRICEGRNLIHEYATRVGATHILFLDTDLRVPADAPAKLLEVDYPVVGGNVPQYGLHGNKIQYKPNRDEYLRWNDVRFPYDFPVERHWNTAGFLLVERQVFTKVRWRTDPDAGLTDDPCFDADCTRLGFPTIVRKDVTGVHVEPLVPVEQRDADRKVYR